MNKFAFVVLAALTIPAAGCAGNPLTGDWQVTITAGAGLTETLTLHLGGDGAASYTQAGSGSCMGTVTNSGFTWTSTATTLTVSGTATCTGMVTCTVLGTDHTAADCSASSSSPSAGACTYALSADNNTLTISNCSNSMMTAPQALTRVSH